MKTKKNKLHFVYAVPHAAKTRQLTLNTYPLYRKLWRYFIYWRKPIAAPYSITYNILQTMSKEYEVLLYDVYEQGEVELGENDLFIGHYWPDMSTKEENNNSWIRYDEKQITNHTVLKYPNDKRVFILSPFNHSTEQLGWAIPLLQRVRHFIGVCGDHWVDTIDHSAYAFLKGKMSHISMGISPANYPRVKQKFNKKGHRKFLYIGRVSKEKNIGMLEAIAAESESFEGGYIGAGTIRGWQQIAPKAILTPALMQSLAGEYDFFINTSTFDAQATTILEAMSWGFVVACTPETGYTEEGVFQLSTDNVEQNVKVIHMLNHMDEHQLMQIADGYQVLVAKKFSWQRFTAKLQQIVAQA